MEPIVDVAGLERIFACIVEGRVDLRYIRTERVQEVERSVPMRSADRLDF